MIRVMSSFKLKLLLVSVFLIGAAFFFGNRLLPTVKNQLAQVIPTATLTLSPSSNSVSVNDTFTVNIILDTSGHNIYGIDVDRLRFNPAILQVVDDDQGMAGVQISGGSLLPFSAINNVDNTNGSIQFSKLVNPGSTFNGSGTLATVTFRAISAGTSLVTFDFTLGSSIDTNIAGLTEDLLTATDLLASVGNGSYDVAPSPTPIPPPPAANKFIIGDRVSTTLKLKIRTTPNSSGKALCTQPKSAPGTVIDGPTVAGGYTWWNVNYDSSCDGWGIEDGLMK